MRCYKNIIKKQYINNLNDITNFKEDILSINELEQILKENNKKNLLLLYKDYLLYYIYKIIEINNINRNIIIIDFLDIIIQICNIDNSKLKFEDSIKSLYIEKILIDEESLAYNFCKIFLFLESQKKFIKYIINIFTDFLEIIPELLQKFIIIFSNTKRNYYPIGDDSNYYLFKIFETFIDSIIDECNFSYYFGNQNEKYFSLIKKNLQFLLKINAKIYSLSIKNLEIFINIINLNNNNLIKWSLKFLQEIRNLIINGKYESNIKQKKKMIIIYMI